MQPLPDRNQAGIVAIGLLTTVLLIVYVAYQRLFSPLASIPGPYWASTTRWWLAYQVRQGRMHTLMPLLHRKYGPVVRIAPNEVSISDPATMRKIYSAGSGFVKSPWYSVWQGRREFDLFGGRDEQTHGQHRRLVTSAYSQKSIQDLEKYVDNAIVHFLGKMDELCSQAVDLGQWLQYFAFDVIGEVTFSKRFGLMDVGDEDGSLTTIKNAITSASWLGQVPWLYWLDDYLSPVFGHRAACQARHGKMRQFAVKEINARQDRGSDHNDILGKLLAIHNEKPKDFNMAGVTSMTSSNIFAGSDTTAASARAVVYFLLKHTQHKENLVEELQTAYREGRLSQIAQRSEVEQLPFLMACVYESLRMHPQPGMNLPRIVPAGGLNVSGFFLPMNTTVGCSSWVIHKNKEVFGADADEFNPERWLKKDTSDMHRHILTFGQGARICIGKNLAETEIMKLIPSLFLHFDVQLADPDRDWGVVSHWFALQEDFYVKIRPNPNLRR